MDSDIAVKGLDICFPIRSSAARLSYDSYPYLGVTHARWPSLTPPPPLPPFILSVPIIIVIANDVRYLYRNHESSARFTLGLLPTAARSTSGPREMGADKAFRIDTRSAELYVEMRKKK